MYGRERVIHYSGTSSGGYRGTIGCKVGSLEGGGCLQRVGTRLWSSMVGSLGCARIARIGQKQRLNVNGKVASLLSELQLIFFWSRGWALPDFWWGGKKEAGEWTGHGLRTLLGSLANKYALFFFKSRPLSMTDLNNFKNHICWSFKVFESMNWIRRCMLMRTRR